MAVPAASERCIWCGRDVDRDEGFRLGDEPSGRRAVFCRLEHVVPWAMRKQRWEAADPAQAPGSGEAVDDCALCHTPLAAARVLLVRHRGEHRIADGFCSIEHLGEWAKRGGRWR